MSDRGVCDTDAVRHVGIHRRRGDCVGFVAEAADSSAPALRTQVQSAQGMLHEYCEGTHHNVLEKREVLELMNAYAESRLLAVREYVERELRKPVQLAADLKLLTDIQEIVKGSAT